ncbi:hypothetical protein [Methylocystis rosea]|uniref:hypothetical protein n=1 Tax=Methylocystis rosea TaxID=173366 RepID=UPI001FEF3C1A|nr:hypothetical protein [Methylocystis rosea]
MAAAVEEGDTPESHADDTVAAGGGLVDREHRAPAGRGSAGCASKTSRRGNAVRSVRARRLPAVAGGGAFASAHRACPRRRRAAIMDILAKEVARTPSIQIVEGYSAQEIMVRGGRAVGVRPATTPA